MNNSQLACLVLTGTALYFGKAQSQTESVLLDNPTLQSVTITGDDESQQRPWATETDRQMLDTQQIQNWSQLGSRAEPGINFNNTNKSLNIRGLDQTRVVTRIDGIRQTYLTDVRGTNGGVRGGSSAIDFNSLSSIDIVRGVDASLVGSGAMGGVVDVHTLSPEDLLTNGKNLGWLAKTGYFSVDNSGLANTALAGRLNNGMQWLLQAGVQSGHETTNKATQGGDGLARTVPNPDQYLQQNYQLKLQKNIEGGHTVGVVGAYYERTDNIVDLMAPAATYAPGQNRVTDKSQRQSIALNYAWTAQSAKTLIDTLAAQAYWQQAQVSSAQEAVRQTTPIGRYLRDNAMQENSYGFDFDAQKKVQGLVSQQWAFGGQGYATDLKQYAGGQDNCPAVYRPYSPCAFFHINQTDVPQTTGTHYGLWLQNTLGFIEDTFSLRPGIRYDRYQYAPSAGSAFSDNPSATLFEANRDSAWSPKLLATWNVNNKWSLFAQYAFSFNAPTATQLYSRFGSIGTYLISGNPTLKPEQGRGWEIGTKFQDRQFNTSLTYFDNRYSNFIEAVNLPGNRQYPYFIQTFQNLEAVRLYGLEARSEWRFDKAWRVFGSLAWTVGTDEQTGRALNSVAPLQGIVGIGYTQPQWGATAQVSAAAARTRVAYPSPSSSQAFSDFQAPGYGIVDVTAYWRPVSAKGISVKLGLFNLFNKTYWNALDVPTAVDAAQAGRLAAGAYTQPGRNASLTVSYQY